MSGLFHQAKVHYLSYDLQRYLADRIPEPSTSLLAYERYGE